MIRKLVVVVVAALVLLTRGSIADPAGSGGNDPEARFRGAPTYDFGVTNVKWEAATPEYSYVTFDLYWSYSWRAKWTEPAATSCTGKDLEVENWDAAWVFVKFLPEKDSQESIERNHWLHASLDTDSAHHVMPAGATNSVKLSDDPAEGGTGGSCGMGAFIYRDAIGHGVNDWKGVKLRWIHARDGVDPGRAAVRAHAVAMVYVPEGPFMIGGVGKSSVMPFADGPDFPVVQHGDDAGNRGSLTDGAWRGGDIVPFLLDADWNAPAADNPRARRIGLKTGRLWATLTYYERAGDSFPLRFTGPLHDRFPTGYDSFYAMKYPMTQGQYVDFLNSLPPDVAAGRAFVSNETGSDAGMHSREVTIKPGPDYYPFATVEIGGNTITSSADYAEKPPADAAGGGLATGAGDGKDILLDAMITEVVSPESRYKRPPVYRARCPFRRLAGVSERDARAFAVWAGLRPATSLEAWKAGRGPRHPAAPSGPASGYDRSGRLEIADEGLPPERMISGNYRHGGGDFAVRVGCFATPASDRAAAQAAYWGISEWGPYPTVAVGERMFRGSHGNGRMPAGSPNGSLKRRLDPVDGMPADWPDSGGYCGSSRHVYKLCWLVAGTGNRIRNASANAGDQGPAVPPDTTRSRWDGAPPAADTVRIDNVKWTTGTKEYGTVSFDLAWDRSWRARWTEPADKNVTGKPLDVESWDAAWVFVKYRMPGERNESPAMLSAEASDHVKPDGAALDVGLDNDAVHGVGVFIYRGAAGSGPVEFKNVTLKWVNPPSLVSENISVPLKTPGLSSSAAPSRGQRPPSGRDGPGLLGNPEAQLNTETRNLKPDVRVYAIEMVHVPEGPFKVKSPWGYPLAVITQADPTKPGGAPDTGPGGKPESPAYPNGYGAFYLMKHPISQGQYADLLNSQASDLSAANYNGHRYSALGYGSVVRFSDRFYGHNGWTIRYDAEAGRYAADAAERHCMLLSLPDIQSFTAWTGLRPPTALEYEKACRGPREVNRDEDAWTPQTCAPAAGLDKAILGDPPPFGPGPSYWGIWGLSRTGCIQEWPALAPLGFKFRGSHGNGSIGIPEDWPWSAFGEGFAMGSYQNFNRTGIWFDERDLAWAASVWPELVDIDRTGRYSARAARTAAVRRDANAPLQVARIPSLRGCEVGIFDLAGQFRNDGNTAVKVEAATPLPGVCFPGGAESRGFTAAPNGVTPFKILTVLTPELAAGALGDTGMLPLRLLGPGGVALAETQVRLPIDRPGQTPTPTIGSFDGGELKVRVANVSDRVQTVRITLDPPAGLKIDPTERQVDVAAGANAAPAFAVPPQGFAAAGVCRIPYRAVAGGGGPVEGRLPANLKVQRRWWIARRIETGPEIGDGGTTGEFEDFGLGNLIAPDAKPSGVPKDLFEQAQPPAEWKSVISGEVLGFDEAFPRDPKQVAAGVEENIYQRAARTALGPRSSVLGATRIHTRAERKVRIAALLLPTSDDGTSQLFRVRAWINDALAYDEGMGGKSWHRTPKSAETAVTLRNGRNTLVVECLSETDKPTHTGGLTFLVLDAVNDRPADGLVFDMEKR